MPSFELHEQQQNRALGEDSLRKMSLTSFIIPWRSKLNIERDASLSLLSCFRVPRRVDVIRRYVDVITQRMQIESSTPYHRHPTYRIIVRTVIHIPVSTMKRRRPDPLPTLQTGKIYKLPGERVHTTHTHTHTDRNG